MTTLNCIIDKVSKPLASQVCLNFMKNRCRERHKCPFIHIVPMHGYKVNAIIPMSLNFFKKNRHKFHTTKESIYDYMWISSDTLLQGVVDDKSVYEVNSSDFSFANAENSSNIREIYISNSNKKLLRLWFEDKEGRYQRSFSGYLCLLYYNPETRMYDFQNGVTGSMERYDKNLKSNKLDFKVTIYREIEEELFDAKQNAMKFVEGEYKKVEIVKFVENTYNNLHDLYLIHTIHLYEN